jgi:hypothetical protein
MEGQRYGRCRILSPEILGVLLREIIPFFGQIVEGKNSRNRADGNTSAAIDAFYRIDVEHRFGLEFRAVFFGMDAVDRASVNTGSVLSSNTGFGDYVSHLEIVLSVG